VSLGRLRGVSGDGVDRDAPEAAERHHDLAGAGVPRAGEVVVSLGRLRGVSVDAVAGTVLAGAGTTLAEVHAACDGTGWRFPLDFGARDRATVGGMVATNAGGVHAMRHGTMRARLAGLEAVLPDGRILRRTLGLTKDSTGYDLTGLLCGSEGTLAVVTAALLRLAPEPAWTTAALVRLGSLPEAVALAAALARVPSVEAVELMAPECLGDATVLVAAAAWADPTPDVADVVDAARGVRQSEVAVDPVRRAALWAVRDGVPETILRTGVPIKLDVAVPPPALATFLDEVVPAVAAVAPDARVWRFGHAADGNIHVNVTGVDPQDEGATAIEDAVLRLAVAHGGTIAAEHGIGVAKVPWLPLSRTAEELRTFAALKGALDPAGILNPGVLGLP